MMTMMMVTYHMTKKGVLSHDISPDSLIPVLSCPVVLNSCFVPNLMCEVVEASNYKMPQLNNLESAHMVTTYAFISSLS